MSWLTEPFALGFMQRALVAGVLTVVVTGLVGTWVVLRGLSFMGDAMAHGVLPGIALAVLLGFDLTLGARASAVVMVGGINVVSRRTRLPEDTGIGLLFVGMLALGVVIISRSGAFAVELTHLLFGAVLGVGTGDLLLQAVAGGIVVLGTLLLYRPFLALSFHEAKAQVLGMHPRLAHVAMLALIAVAIVSSFRTVGALLVFALLIAPPATASVLVGRVPSMMAAAVAVGSLSVVGGLLISYHLDTAAGATIAGLSVAVFFFVVGVQGLVRGLRARVASA